ncbi:MAG: hypothetical protein HYX92_12155 [Chloroflexi bacterium]|nr:hypothetical protein [Chloroflexota bacterium]
MTAAPVLIVFTGGLGGSPVECIVAEAQRCITLDTIRRAQVSGAFSGIILVTDSEDLSRRADPSVCVERSGADFHFGESLRSIIRKYAVESPLYIGGGSAPLLTSNDLAAIAGQISEGVVVTNNLFSSDLVAFHPGSAIEAIELPRHDNPLAQLLRHQAGLKEVCLARNAATQFDVDTPSDLLVLSLHPGAGDHVRAYLGSLKMDASRLRQAMPLFTDPMAEIVVAGRVGSQVWARLEEDTACRVRVFSEERGMRADGREERGEARSLLGLYLERVGLTRFFQTMGELGAAAFIDSRVIFAHMGIRPTSSDRFLSDFGQPEGIADDFVRRFTEEALAAPKPVFLGGHSMVAGGLLALIDAAWRDKDLGKEGSAANNRAAQPSWSQSE